MFICLYMSVCATTNALTPVSSLAVGVNIPDYIYRLLQGRKPGSCRLALYKLQNVNNDPGLKLGI